MYPSHDPIKFSGTKFPPLEPNVSINLIQQPFHRQVRPLPVLFLGISHDLLHHVFTDQVPAHAFIDESGKRH